MAPFFKRGRDISSFFWIMRPETLDCLLIISLLLLPWRNGQFLLSRVNYYASAVVCWRLRQPGEFSMSLLFSFSSPERHQQVPVIWVLFFFYFLSSALQLWVVNKFQLYSQLGFVFPCFFHPFSRLESIHFRSAFDKEQFSTFLAPSAK